MYVRRAKQHNLLDYRLSVKQISENQIWEGCVCDWGSVPSGVLQGTKLGPWLFLITINDLVVENARLWKYVDDTTISETVAKRELSNAQRTIDRVIQWSLDNRVQLNSDKCKELRISFTKSQQEFKPILIYGDALEVVEIVNFSSDLTWNIHINETIKKAFRDYIFWFNLRELRLLALT